MLVKKHLHLHPTCSLQSLDEHRTLSGLNRLIPRLTGETFDYLLLADSRVLRYQSLHGTPVVPFSISSLGQVGSFGLIIMILVFKVSYLLPCLL